MKYLGRKRWYRRITAMVLALMLCLTDGTLVSAAEAIKSLENTVSAGDTEFGEVSVSEGDTTEPEEVSVSEGDATEPEEVSVSEGDVAESKEESVSEGNATELEEISVSGGDLTNRAPESFYENPAPENYGTLVNYDAYSRTYHVEGNRYVTVIGNDGATYLDDEGILQKTDNTLIENPMNMFSGMGTAPGYVNRANDYTVLFNQCAEGGELFSIVSGDYVLTVTPTEGSFADGVTKENAIRYSNVFPDVDYQYTVLGGSVKEDIILLRPQEKTSFSYLINPCGLKAELIRNSLYLYEEGKNPEKEPVFVLEAPEMEDAAGEISFGVKMSVEECEDGIYVTVTADDTWLHDEGRVYPVRIDPTAIEVGKSAIHVACAEEGSPNSVIGDNSYPYVGYDDGITSGNLAGFNSKHLNCRSYFDIDYNFAALAAEAEIVSATFQVTQKTHWSKGRSEFGLFGVEEPWNVGTLTWNNQLNYSHYFLDSLPSASNRGESLSYDVTEEVSAWINGVAENHGLVMKAMVEAPNEETAGQGVSMQCEVFHNNSSAAYAPKLILSWMGELIDLDSLTLDDTTIDVYPVVERNGDKSTNTLGVVAHGLAKPGSSVHYQLVDGRSGETVAEKSLLYPDSVVYEGAFPTALPYKRRMSNWQSVVFSGLTPGVTYYVTAYADGMETDSENPDAEPVYGVGKKVQSDTFLIYEESAFDLIPRIASHYGVEIGTIMSDMKMQDALTKEGNRIFIRNPKNTAPYSSGELSEYYKAIVDGLLLGRAQNCVFGYEPINLNTGNFYMSHSDAELPEIGGTFTWARQYNSKGAGYCGSLGYGWSAMWDERLGELADGSVIWLTDSGNIVTFTGKGDGGYAAPAGWNYTLEETEDGYRITQLSDGKQHIFDNYGLLSALVDAQGNRTSFAYDMDYHLKAVTTPSGKVFSVSLDEEERVKTVTLPDGCTIQYTYDDAGNLVKVTDQMKDVIRYEYNASHYMTAWYDANGHRVVQNDYDGEGRVTKQTDAEGGVVTLAYEKETSGGRTVSTDANGNVTIYHYDEQYRTTLVEYPDGTTEKRSYNAAGYLASVTDREGVTTEYAYDGKGNLTAEKRQDGAKREFTYNELHQITSQTDFDGAVTSYAYDELHRLTSVTDAEGGKTTYTYDELNRMVSETNPKGAVTAYTYQGACVTSIQDALGNKQNFTYDAMNRLLTSTDSLGAVTKQNYDKKGRRIIETDALGHSTVYTFDAAGAVIAITDKEGQKSTFTYDAMNRLLTGLDPLGNTLTYIYDANGNRISEKDAEGSVYTYTYDTMNRMVSETDGRGVKTTYVYNGNDVVLSMTDGRDAVTSYAYDAVKKVLLSDTDAEGNVTSYETDVCGRIVKTTYADGGMELVSYDKLGRPVSMTDRLGMVSTLTYDGCGNVTALTEEGRTYTYEYDLLNRLVKTVDPLGGETLYTYDAAGNLKKVTDALGNATNYTYDAAGRLLSVLDALDGMTAYTYDAENRVLTVTAPEGGKLTNTYDAIGQLTVQEDALGGLTSYAYNGVSQLVKVTDALKGVTEYTYDADGNLTEFTDVRGNSHSYETDAVGNLLKDTYPNEETENYTYDKNGNIYTFTDRYGIVTTFTYDAMDRIVKAVDTAGNVMNYTYDKAGNILTQSDVLGRTAVYTYDRFGRPVSVKGIDGVTTKYEYDALDRLVKVTDGEGKVTSYSYDALGNLIGTDEPGEASYAYTYDALNRLTKKVDPEGATTEFVYNKNGSLTEVKDGNGVKTSYAYDALDRLTEYTDGNGGQTIYTYDALSRLTRITTPEGLTEDYTYDAAGNLTSVTDGLGQKTSYLYDKLNRLVREVSPMGAKQTYTYDRHDVVTSVTDALGNVTLYEVNANGQVTKKREADGASYLYSYDEVMRLIKVTTPLGYQTTFSYNDGNDLLVQSDNTDRETTFTYDIMHRMTSVTDPEGGITKYTYDVRGNSDTVTDALGFTWEYGYDKLDRMISVTDPEKKAYSLLYDKEGNLKSITTPGERTTTYTYDKNYNTVGVTDPMGYTYATTYDKDDRIVGEENPLGETTAYVYDAANRVTSITDRMGLSVHFTYDAHGNILEKTDTAGLKTSYTYDLKNRLTSLTDPMGSTAYYTYDVRDNLTAVTDYMGHGTEYTYDLEGNLTSITDVMGRKETMTYDEASRLTSYTSNGGNTVTYDYDKLNDMVEKSYADAAGEQSANPVTYAYNALGERVSMYDATGETAYTYDGLGRITSVTTYRTEEADGSINTGNGNTIGYSYDEADNLSAITYPDGTKVVYTYDKNDNLIKVTDRNGEETTYVYDALNRIMEIHRPNGVSTYNTYNARDQITELVNTCDECGWVVSSYAYTYDNRGFIVSEKAVESLAGYAYDDKHGDKHTDGRHDDRYPHGTKHNGKHDKDADYPYRIVETDRTFTYDDAGKLLSATETEDNYGTYIYTYEYDLMGNRTAETKTKEDGTVAQWHKYAYNESNQLESEELYDGKKTTKLAYTYDADGNRISESGTIGTDKVEKTYEYSVENRLEAVYDAGEVLMAAAYDGDGNRVFQLNYNLHTDEDRKGNSGNGNSNNKDNKGSVNNGKGSSGNAKGNSKSEGTDDAGYGNATNAEEYNSQNQSGILFPRKEQVSSAEHSLIDKISTSGKYKNYELIEYLNDVNREYAEVLVELNINGKTDTGYIYGVNRLERQRFNNETGYYLYDPKGSVMGITNEKGQLTQSYRYDAFGNITFGAPQYENEYAYNGESYNPNIRSQYLRARYYDVTTADFLTEDSYLGDITEPLTLNRYNYCIGNPVNYRDPSGNAIETVIDIVSIVWSASDLIKKPSWGNAGMLVWDIVGTAVPFLPGSWVVKAGDKIHDAWKAAKKVAPYVDEIVQYSGKVINKAVKKAGPYVDEIVEGADKAVTKLVTKVGPYVDNAIDGINKTGRWISDTYKKVDNKLDDVLMRSERYLSDKAGEAASYVKNLFCHGDEAAETIVKNSEEISEAAQNASGTLSNVLDEAVDDKPDIPNGAGDNPTPDPGDGSHGDKTPDGDKPKGEGGSVLAQYGDEFGKMGTYVENPGIKIDWTQYAEHGFERMQQRGMTQELVNNIVENGKVLSQNNGSKFAYITQEGVAIVSKEGKLITTWSSADFDSNMLEIVGKLFGGN